MANQALAPWWRQSAACLGLEADRLLRASYVQRAGGSVLALPQAGQRCFSDQHKKRGREKATSDRSKQSILSGRFEHFTISILFNIKKCQ